MDASELSGMIDPSLHFGRKGYEQQYYTLLSSLYNMAGWSDGIEFVDDRTGTGRVSRVGPQLVIDLYESFPALQFKSIWFKGVVAETLWMLKGHTDLQTLHDDGVHFWDAWAKDDGTLGPTYGKQIRNHNGIDQWSDCVESIRNNPTGRRHIITTWNPSELSQMPLPPCHGLVIQFVPLHGELSLVMHQRSCDVFVGLPFNMCNYALMLHIMAKLTNHVAARLVINIGDAHLYRNHLDAANKYLGRFESSTARAVEYHLPQLVMGDFDSVEEAKVSDFQLIDYNPQGVIKAPVAV